MTETQQFLNDKKLNELYDSLHKTHKPIKATISDDTLRDIGKIIVTFQRLEHTVHSFIGILANVMNNQTTWRILTAELPFKNSLWMLSNLANQTSFPQLDELNKLVDKAFKAEEIRNQIVHSIWTSGPRFKTTAKKKGVKFVSETYENGELADIWNQIDKIDTSIDALDRKYIEWCRDCGDIPNGVKFVSN